eukprot:CAMPEP_0182447710 /NCGR_PEP_ID=MMETSP1172-20130603/19118_1 /TAXON_ID=708627 /ORGANISM="Timspurckia oligopyrenoides, Strain CCMP3278" /LENGTH=445 /DNA_ID=CAMNT_0024644251 /DNA_START=537 /DNA_END=1874 /DNA_ORIENTATION=-
MTQHTLRLIQKLDPTLGPYKLPIKTPSFYVHGWAAPALRVVGERWWLYKNGKSENGDVENVDDEYDENEYEDENGFGMKRRRLAGNAVRKNGKKEIQQSAASRAGRAARRSGMNASYENLNRKAKAANRGQKKAVNKVRCACGIRLRTEHLIVCVECTCFMHKFCAGIGIQPLEVLGNGHEKLDLPDAPIEQSNAHFKCFICAPDACVKGSLADDVAQEMIALRNSEQWASLRDEIEQSAVQESASRRAAKAASKKSKNTSRNRAVIPNPVRKTVVPRDAGIAERQFLAAWQRYWYERGEDYTELPTFRGPQLDLYALYTGVRDRGGLQAVIQGKMFKQVWVTMRNFYPAATDFSYKLKQLYQTYIVPYVRDGPSDEEVFAEDNLELLGNDGEEEEEERDVEMDEEDGGDGDEMDEDSNDDEDQEEDDGEEENSNQHEDTGERQE